MCVLRLGKRQPAAPRLVDNHPRQGVVGTLFASGRQSQNFVRRPVERDHLGDLETSLGDRPGLVEHRRVHLRGVLQDAAPAQQAPQDAAAPGATQNAVIDAVSYLGVRHIDMPTTPERIWTAISAARESQ